MFESKQAQATEPQSDDGRLCSAEEIMGKPKTQRTEDLHNAARRYTVAKQVEKAIEQHRLVAQGIVVKEAKQLLIEEDKYQAYRRLLQNVVTTEPTGNPEIYDYDPEYRRPTANSMIRKGGGLRKA